MKLTIEPLKLLSFGTIGQGAPRILVISGIHGDEIAGPLALDLLVRSRWFDVVARNGFNIDVLALINPTGFKNGTRENDARKDLNRFFFDGSYEGEPAECAAVKSIFAFVPAPYDFFISIHEDLERQEFYLYDAACGRQSELVEKIFRVVRVAGIPLYTGLDDLELRNQIKDGYCEVLDASGPFLESYLLRNGKAKKGVIIEIPGKLNLESKIELVVLVLEELFA